jgi:hypothetical protein
MISVLIRPFGLHSKPLQSIALELQSHGLPVSCVDDDPGRQQVYLSVCGVRDATTGLPTSGILHWKFVPQNQFATECTPAPPEPAPEPEPAVDHCVSGQHGPPCHPADDCTVHGGCLRCAKSGFCTDQPL